MIFKIMEGARWQAVAWMIEMSRDLLQASSASEDVVTASRLQA
jgi:hypothetical protein